MINLRVREARSGDLPAVVKLWQESMALHAQRDRTFQPSAEGARLFEQFAAERLVSGRAIVVVAEADDQIAGYGICVLKQRPAWFRQQEYGAITDLDVSARFRRQGAGGYILHALCNWLVERGVQRVEAEVVTANELSLAFWGKHGFSTYSQAMFRQP